MGLLGVVNKDSIDAVHKNGLVKPNEYEAIRDNVIAREIYLRAEKLSLKSDKFLSVLLDTNFFQDFYFLQTGINETKSAIIYLAYNDPETLLLDQDDIAVLILSDVAYSKAMLVRDLGDINKSNHLDGMILADKDSLRALEYLTKHKRGLWDLLQYLKEE